MKIAMVDNVPVGGAKRVVFEQVKGLAARHTIDVYTNEHSKTFPFREYCRNLEVFPLHLASHRGWRRFLTEVSLITSLVPDYVTIAKRINQSDVDVVIVHPCMISQAPIALLLIRKPKIYFAEEWLRIVYEPQLFPIPRTRLDKQLYESFRRKLLEIIDKRAVQAADKVITTSRYNQEHLFKAYGVKAEVISLGVDTELFKPDKGARHNYYLFLGNRTKADGYDLLEQALELTKAKLIIREVACDGTVFRKTDAEMAELYRHAVATLCLAVAEPFGLTAIESMACGTPVIAVNEGGYQETVINNVTGRLIRRDPQDLLEAMIQSSLIPEHRMRRQFSWEAHIERLERSLSFFGV